MRLAHCEVDAAIEREETVVDGVRLRIGRVGLERQANRGLGFFNGLECACREEGKDARAKAGRDTVGNEYRFAQDVSIDLIERGVVFAGCRRR